MPEQEDAAEVEAQLPAGAVRLVVARLRGRGASAGAGAGVEARLREGRPRTDVEEGEELEEQDTGAHLLLEEREAEEGVEDGAGATDEVAGTLALFRRVRGRAEALVQGRARGLARVADNRSGEGGGGGSGAGRQSFSLANKILRWL